MRVAPRTLLVASQVAYFGGLAVDVALQPHYLVSANEGGVSNFGVHAVTAGPFTVAFAGSAALLALAACATVPTGDQASTGRGLWRSLLVVSCALLAAMATTYPYQHGVALHTLHLAVGAAAMASEALVAAWLYARLRRGPFDAVGLCLALGGALLAVLASVGVLRVLFVAQVVEAAGLGVLLVRAPGALASRGRQRAAG